MHYTSSYKEISAMGYRERKSDAKKDASQLGMSLHVEKDGYFLSSRKIEVVVYERNDRTNEIVRQCNPCPYLEKRRPDFKSVDIRPRLDTLVRKLNQGKARFDDVIKAEAKAKEEAKAKAV